MKRTVTKNPSYMGTIFYDLEFIHVCKRLFYKTNLTKWRQDLPPHIEEDISYSPIQPTGSYPELDYTSPHTPSNILILSFNTHLGLSFDLSLGVFKAGILCLITCNVHLVLPDYINLTLSGEEHIL